MSSIQTLASLHLQVENKVNEVDRNVYQSSSTWTLHELQDHLQGIRQLLNQWELQLNVLL